MKAVLLFASPKRNGFTGVLAEKYIAALPADCSVARFDAYDMMAKPCIACGACAEKNFCPYDDLNEFFAAVSECDLLIIASPVYFLSFPAPLKAVVDRLQRFHEAEGRGDNPMRSQNRRCVVLLTAGAPSEKGEIISKQLRWAAAPLGITETKIIVCADTDRDDRKSFLLKADEILNDVKMM